MTTAPLGQQLILENKIEKKKKSNGQVYTVL
jgi:hypothetical protein